MSPDGDSTTAPPSQSSEHSDMNHHPHMGMKPTEHRRSNKIQSASLGAPPDHPPVLVEETFLPSRSLDDDRVVLGRRKLESPTESYDSNHSNVVNVPVRDGGGGNLMDITRMKKVISELIDTERNYVSNLSHMIKLYLEPLQEESFMSESEVTSLFGNIQEIFSFQREFLQALEEAVESDSNAPVSSLDSPKQLKNVLLSVAGTFLFYTDHFKLYSSFCASHSKAQKALHPSKHYFEG